MSRSLLPIAAIAVALAGCAGQVREAPMKPPQEVVEAIAEDSEILPRTDPDVIYYVGAAEILGHREEFAASARFYLRAAQLSGDPQISARAVRVAAFAEDDEKTAAAVARWLELAPESPEPNQYAAVMALREGDPERAWEHIQLVLGSGADLEQWDRVARMLAQTPNREAAVAVFDRVVADMQLPRIAQLYQQYSDLSVQLGRLESAENLASASIDLEPGNAEAYDWRARIRHSLRRLPEARDDFAQAVELAPEQDSLRQSYAAVLAELSAYDEALAQLDHVQPNPAVIYSKAIYAKAANEEQRARDYFDQLHAFDAEDESRKAYMLGQLSETLEMEADVALSFYAQVTQGDHLDDARLRSAVVLAQSDRMPQAQAILARLKNGNAETAARAYTTEAALLREAGEDKAALAVYDRALDLLPDNTDLLYARSLHAEQMGMIDMTERDMRRILQLQPNSPNVLNALGYTLANRTDRFDEALELIEAAHKMLPNEAAVIDSLGWVHYKLGNYELALEHLNRALELEFDPEISAHLGEVLWVLGREDEARAVWSDALERVPEADTVLEARERLSGE